MKRTSAVLTGPGQFEIMEDEIQCPDKGVVIRVDACGLCMSDVPAYQGNDQTIYPVRPGHQGSGTVVEVGPRVQNLAEGDRVTGIFSEAFADHASALENNLVTVPKSVKLEHALGDMLMSCVSAVRMAAPLPGDTIMVSGCGAMGLIVLSLLSSPALTTIAVDRDESKLGLAKKLNIPHTLQRQDSDLKKKVIELSRGRGVDVCIEVTGESKPFHFDASTLVYGKGKLVVLCIKGTECKYDIGAMINGTILYATHPGFFPEQHENLHKAMSLLEKNIFPMDDIITHQYKLEEIQTAFEELLNRPEGYVKGIIKT